MKLKIHAIMMAFIISFLLFPSIASADSFGNHSGSDNVIYDKNYEYILLNGSDSIEYARREVNGTVYYVPCYKRMDDYKTAVKATRLNVADDTEEYQRGQSEYVYPCSALCTVNYYGTECAMYETTEGIVYDETLLGLFMGSDTFYNFNLTLYYPCFKLAHLPDLDEGYTEVDGLAEEAMEYYRATGYVLPKYKSVVIPPTGKHLGSDGLFHDGVDPDSPSVPTGGAVATGGGITTPGGLVFPTGSAVTTSGAFSSPAEAYLYDIRNFVFWIFTVLICYIIYRLVRIIFL